MLEDNALLKSLTAKRSPKSVTLPVEAIVTYSITFNLLLPSYPPKNNPLVVLDAPPNLSFPTLKSPKSVLFPTDAIVTYSITLSLPPLAALPPPVIPLVLLLKPALLFLPSARLPKSVAFPLY